MTGDLLVRGGTLVDGTGEPARRADVRVRGGVVTEVGPDLRPDGEVVVDAGGALVAPGFIDSHTHYDPSLWWDPLLDPIPQHGVTTVITGNCSLSLTPVRAGDRLAASDVFGFIEDIPVDAFTTGIPWNWESYAEWRDALSDHRTAVNIAALIGHSNLRVYVMGDEAWERAATPEERDKLASVLRQCLDAGALGMSTSFVDQDRHGTPVPSRRADEAELMALIDVLAEAEGGPRTLEFLPWIKEIDRQLDDIERMARWCGPRRVPCTWNQLSFNTRDPSRAERIIEQAEKLHAAGCRVYGQVSPRPFSLNISFDQSPAFIALPTWNGLIQESPEKKRKLLADEDWRARARDDWDRVGTGFTIFPVNDLARVRLVSTRPEHQRFAGATMADLVAARGGHPSDVLADWVLEHDLAPDMRSEAATFDYERTAALIENGTTVVGASDAGAHLQMMCGAGDSTLLLTDYVRDRGVLSIEAAVHQLTGRLAAALGIPDRGVVEPGRAGDLTVFDLDELTYLPDAFVNDLPGGAPRLTRPPGGFRYTAVAGVVTQEAGVATGERPAGPIAVGA